MEDITPEQMMIVQKAIENSNDDPFSKAIFEQQIDPMTITQNLLDPENIAMKTEIDFPYELAQLQAWSFLLREYDLENCANYIDNIVNNYLINMTSYKRKRVLEVASILSGAMTTFITWKDRLFSDLDKDKK